MRVEIDQSWKIEYTNKQTVLADSQGNGVVLSAKSKRYLQDVFRKAGRPRMFVYEVFAALVTFLIQLAEREGQHNLYVVDKEYPGWSDEIKGMIFKFSRKLDLKLELEQIRFAEVGKGSRAHDNAYLTFKGSRRATKTIQLEEVLRLVMA